MNLTFRIFIQNTHNLGSVGLVIYEWKNNVQSSYSCININSSNTRSRYNRIQKNLEYQKGQSNKMDKKDKIVVIATVAAIAIAIYFSQSVLREVYRSIVELLSPSSSPSSIVLIPSATHLEQTGNDIFTKHWLLSGKVRNYGASTSNHIVLQVTITDARNGKAIYEDKISPDPDKLLSQQEGAFTKEFSDDDIFGYSQSLANSNRTLGYNVKVLQE